MRLPICNLNISKQLKEIGFDLKTQLYWDTDNPLGGVIKTKSRYLDQNTDEILPMRKEPMFEGELDEYSTYLQTPINSAPTLALVQMWLREKHNLFILMQLGGFVNDKQTYYCNIFRFGKNLYKSHFRSKTSIYTYDQALEAGILEAIKLIKTKQDD